MDENATGPEPSSKSFLNRIPPSPTPEPDLRGVFVAKSGLIRAGWGVALFILIFLATRYVIGFLFQSSPPTSGLEMSPRAGFTMEVIHFSWVFVATAVLAIIERKSLLAYGYRGTARAVRFFSGLAWGFIAISAFLFLLWKSHLLTFDGQSLHGASLVKYAALWGSVFLLTAVFEESALRGYVQYTMTRGVGFWWGALVFSLLFGLGHTHNPGESPVGLFSAGAIGLVFCLSIWYTGSLWWAVGFHAAWDWGESYFYGTSDSGILSQGHLFSEHPLGKILWSGGKTGPEGSILIVPLLIIIAILMWLWWGRRAQSPFKGQGWRPLWSQKRRQSSIAESSGGEPVA